METLTRTGAGGVIAGGPGLARGELPLEANPRAVPLLDESDGGWCSDAPRPRPRNLSSWLDFETADSVDAPVW